MKEIKIVYEDGYVYTDTGEVKGELTIENQVIDATMLQANMDYVVHMGWSEDFYSLNKADELIKEVWVGDNRVF